MCVDMGVCVYLCVLHTDYSIYLSKELDKGVAICAVLIYCEDNMIFLKT